MSPERALRLVIMVLVIIILVGLAIYVFDRMEADAASSLNAVLVEPRAGWTA
jgi:hypothetical protein